MSATLQTLARPEAERLAREAWTALATAVCRDPSGAPAQVGFAAVGDVPRAFVDAHLDLLCDLSRPASRDYWSLWIAERVCGRAGWPLPIGSIFQNRPGMLVGVMIRVAFAGHANLRDIEFHITGAATREGVRNPYEKGDEPRYVLMVPALYSITEPSEALVAAVLAVSGVPHG